VDETKKQASERRTNLVSGRGNFGSLQEVFDECFREAVQTQEVSTSETAMDAKVGNELGDSDSLRQSFLLNLLHLLPCLRDRPVLVLFAEVRVSSLSHDDRGQAGTGRTRSRLPSSFLGNIGSFPFGFSGTGQ